MFLYSCEENEENEYNYLLQQSDLRITGLSKTEGFFGDEVVISGSGFSSNISGNLVAFNGAKAEVLEATTSSIKVKVPFPSSTGKVTVTTNREEAPGPIFTLVLPPAETIAYTSFEEVPTFIGDIFYNKAGTVVMDNTQASISSSTDPYVDFTATGQELGFDSSFAPTDVGDPGIERIGVFSNPNIETRPGDFEARFTQGTQGFLTSDLDGTMEIVFDQVDLTDRMVAVTLEVDVYFASTTFETAEGFFMYYKVDNQLGEALISFENNEVEANQGEWKHFSAEVPLDKIKPGNIVVRMKNSSNSEMIFIDKVEIKGVTVN